MRTAIIPGGYAIIGTFAIDGPNHCSGLEVNRHDASSVSELMGSAFRFVDTRTEDHRTPTGLVQHFTWFVLRHVTAAAPSSR